uniref:Integrin alpha-6-like n=1 Tax=Phallusia mammillata TaxID=59560 RepID=A0A6F9DEP4_9ASCI|nr:integrin alpha-6-like [Phallusia mammillata]
MTYFHVNCILFLLLTAIGLASAFNLEDRLPIIKRGPSGSLFGISVTQHHVSENANNIDDVVMLVGAPTADAQSFHDEDSYKPGALFKCNVSPSPNDCQVVPIDDSGNTLQQNNSNQWLGVVVKRQKAGGKIAVCAPRYTRRGGTIARGIIWEAELGRCYLLESNLQASPIRSEWIPCNGKLDPDGSYSHEWYGYCQAGMSVDFANNEDEDIVFGMPGPFHWTGAINSHEMNQNTFFPIDLWSKEDSTEESIPQNSYLGFSLATGHLSGSFINFVAGAPRANDTGIVVIFEKETQGVQKSLLERETLRGEKLASAFGYDVKIIDVNGDSRDDLLVGAPQYYDKEKKRGGAVYIYINKGLDLIGPTPTKILYGEIDSFFGNSITSLGDINMDGANDIAIGAPGHDEGKGAVYIFHGNSEPNEGVYTEPVQVLLAKNLTDSGKINFNMTSFGYSVNGGLDMDLNGYPDLMVGSLSDTAVLYRSRPIVNVQGSLSASVKKIAINPEGNANTISYTSPTTGKEYKLVTFNVTVCMKYTSTPISFDESVSMAYNIKLDVTRSNTGLRPRVTFAPLDYQQGSMMGSIILYPQSQKRLVCADMPVYLANDIQDKLSPIDMTMEFDVPVTDVPVETADSGLVSFNTIPILNTEIPNTASAMVNISKECGPDEICSSNLQMEAQYVVLQKDDLWHNLGNKGPGGDPLLLIGLEKEIGLRIGITNENAEDAHQAKLKITLPPFLQYIGLAKTNASAATVSCTTDILNKSLVICSLGNPFRTNSMLEMIVRLENDDRLYYVNEFTVLTQIFTSSTQPELDKVTAHRVLVKVQAQINIEGYPSVDQVEFGGNVVGESAVKQPEDAGLYIGHTYEIINSGSSDVPDVYVNISWPQLIHNGKWLFYLINTEISGPGKNNETVCYVPEQETNPLNLKLNPLALSSPSRKKRDVDVSEGSPETSSVGTKKTVSTSEILKCSGLAKCVHFTCSLGTLETLQKVFIKLNAVVWNSTFLEEYYGVAEIRVFSEATVAVDRGNILYAQSSVLSYQVSTSILSEQVIPPEQEVGLLVIAVATLAGVILLVIIVLVMWRFGFFERRRFNQDLPTHKAKRSQNVKTDKAVSQRILQHQTSWQVYSD